MGRKKAAIVFPRLNDCGGDTTKKWYVEWSYRIPGEIKPRREREYSALNLLKAAERYKAAEKFISEKRDWLESGAYLAVFSKEKVYEDELAYHAETRLYGNLKKGVDFITDIAENQQLSTLSCKKYVQILRTFFDYKLLFCF